MIEGFALCDEALYCVVDCVLYDRVFVLCSREFCTVLYDLYCLVGGFVLCGRGFNCMVGVFVLFGRDL